MSNFTEIDAAIANWCANNQEPAFDPANPKIFLHHPTFGAEEISAFTRQMLTTRVTMGEKVRAFEEEYCKLLNSPYGVSNNSGSSANLLMLSALTTPLFDDALKPGDEVILPALTWSTSLWPIVQRGLVPVFVDSDPDTLNMRPELVEAAIGPKTRAVMVVPIYGNPCDMDALTDICDRHNLIMIEDSCESMGATYDGRAVGTFGLMSSFSFYFSHHATTLEGGIVVTKSAELQDIMRIHRAHGWVRDVSDRSKFLPEGMNYDPRFTFVDEGYNLRLTEPQAAMGLVQLKKLNDFVVLRQQHAAKLKEGLAPFTKYMTPQQETAKASHSWFGFPIVLTEAAEFTRDELTAHLNEAGIETRPIIAGNLVRHPATNRFETRTQGELTGADKVMDQGFAIPCHQSLSDEAINHMIDTFKRFFSKD